MARIIIITPNPLVDCLHDGDLIPGKVTRSPGMHIVAGGKGLNVGRVLHAHGHEVIATGFAGGWTGKAFRDIVRNEGQEDAFIDCAARLRLGFLAKDCNDAGSTALLENGFRVHAAEQDALIELLGSRLNEVQLCIVSGSVPNPSCNALFTRITEVCAQQSIPCWVDSYGAAMDQVLDSQTLPNFAKPNLQEFEMSTSWQRLGECHVTDGENPTRITYQQQTYLVKPPPISCVNPIGSGDSYVGALAHARLSDWPIEQQFAYAAAAGAVNARQMAVAQMTPDDIAELAKSVHVSLSN